MSEPVEVIARVCAELAAGRKDGAARFIAAEYPFAPVAKVERRYTADQALRVFIQDGFIDRYTGNRLVFSPVRHIIHDLLPDAFPHHPVWKTNETHPAFNDLSATLDHVIPVASGGPDEDSNWVTTSMAVNFAKNNASLPGLQWRLQPPGSFREWDGMWIAPVNRALAAA